MSPHTRNDAYVILSMQLIWVDQKLL